MIFNDVGVENQYLYLLFLIERKLNSFSYLFLRFDIKLSIIIIYLDKIISKKFNLDNMGAIAKILIFNSIFYLVYSSHLHSKLNFQRKSKKIKYSEDASCCDPSGIGIGHDLYFNKTVKNVQRLDIPTSRQGMKEKMESSILEIGLVSNIFKNKNYFRTNKTLFINISFHLRVQT